MQHFVVKFSQISSGGKGALTPPNQNPADALASDIRSSEGLLPGHMTTGWNVIGIYINVTHSTQNF